MLDALRLDDTTVQLARAALADVALEQRVYERLLRRARDRLGAGQSLADLASPAAVLAFAPQDAAGGLPAIPAVYGLRAWRELLDPAVEPTIAEHADEAGWVLNDRSPATQRVLQQRSAREQIARQVGRRHAQAVIAEWDRLLSTLALQIPGGGEPLERFGATLAAADSPLRQLLRRIATEFPPVAGAPAGSPASQAFGAALDEHFGTLRQYAVGAGAIAVDRLVAPLAGALQEPAGVRATELGRALQAEAERAPPPLRKLWSDLADALAEQQRRTLERRLGGGLNELAQSCRRLTADRFPFASNARRDMPYADFARVFGPNGLLEAFFQARLASQVDSKHRPWRWLGDASPSEKAQATLRSFEMADSIRRLFFPPGSELPQLRLQLTPAAMDGELLLFSADIDGQLLRYENGPRRPKAVVWPGPAATQRVLLRILPAGPSDVGAEVHEGPWALLRVLQRHGWQRSNSAASLARLEVDGRVLSVEVTADAPVSAALLGELPKFRCPETW